MASRRLLESNGEFVQTAPVTDYARAQLCEFASADILDSTVKCIKLPRSSAQTI